MIYFFANFTYTSVKQCITSLEYYLHDCSLSDKKNISEFANIFLGGC